MTDATSPDPDAARPDAPPPGERVGTVTLARTWELELFISGATVFALLRAPGLVDAWWARTDPHLEGGANLAAFFTFYYAKLILYTVISTFLVHLLARAYWVGLVGLHSVYPGGVRWEALNYGPAFRAVFRERLPSLERMIHRVDDLSSLLFSGGAVILLVFLSSIVFIFALGTLGMATARLFPGGQAIYVAAAIFAVLTLGPWLAKLIDLGRARSATVGAPPRALRRAALFSYYLSFGPVVGPLSLVLSSNLGRRTASTAMILVIGIIVGTFIVRDVMLGSGRLRADSHAYIPDAPVSLEQRPGHYADQRSPGAVYPRTAAIQSEMVRDPYIRLFIPVTPERHNPVIAEHCPGVPRFRGGLRTVPRRPAAEPVDITPLLACLARLHPVSLDGARLDPLPFRLTTDAASGLRGIVAHLPVAGLQPGEHVLRIEPLPSPRVRGRLGGRGARPAAAPELIRFWL